MSTVDASRLAQLEGANQQLRGRLQEVLSELQAAQGELAGLRVLQARWEEEAPGAPELIEAALARERAAQDARSERVLALLQSKASRAEDCCARCGAAHCIRCAG